MTAAGRSLSSRIGGMALSPSARPLRFAGTGGTAGVLQLLLLALLTRHGWYPLAANGVAFLVAAQVNFGLSAAFTWRDRVDPDSLPRSWALFHGSIALMALVNMLAFAVSRLFLPVVVASLAGIAAGALGNYSIGDRLVFRDRGRIGETRPEDDRPDARHTLLAS